jgi:hypothetical protein
MSASDDLFALIARETLWWESIEFTTKRVDEVIPSWANPNRVRGEMTEHYVETRAGLRHYEIREGASASRGVTLTVYCNDGKRSTMTHERLDPKSVAPHREVRVTSSFGMEEAIAGTMRPPALGYLYVDKEYLYKALERARPQGESQVGGFRCLAFEFPDILWAKLRQTIVYSIDVERGIPIRVESFEVADRTRRQWVWEVKELTTVDGHSFPARMIMIHYTRGKDGSPIIEESRFRNELVSIAFNKTYPATLFQPTLLPGTRVRDDLAKKDYLIPGGDSKATTESPVTPVVLAIEPSGWEASASAVVFGCGAVLVIFGLVLRWYRRMTPGI